MTTLEIEVTRGDVSPSFEALVRNVGRVAWDIETSGLDWRVDEIATCQLHVEGHRTEVVRLQGTNPARLSELIASPQVTKVFHHAMFDLRFMRFHWSVRPANVACTKMISKLVDADPHRPLRRMGAEADHPPGEAGILHVRHGHEDLATEVAFLLAVLGNRKGAVAFRHAGKMAAPRKTRKQPGRRHARQ